MAQVDGTPIKFSPKPKADECMYSGEALDGSIEHILPEAIGGTLKSDTLITSRVNALSSRVLEPALFKPLEMLCYYLGIPSKKGERHLRLSMSDGRLVKLGPDLRPTLVDKPKPTIVRAPGQLQISLSGTNYQQLWKVARTAAGKDKSLIEVESVVHTEPLEPMQVSFCFDAPLWTNAIRKSALSLLGYFNPKLARSPELEEARFLVFTAMTHPPAESPSFPSLALLDGGGIIDELGVQEIGPFDHVLVVSCEPATRRAVAFLRLFGGIDNAVVLSSTYDGPEGSFVYCRNPISSDSTGTVRSQTDRSCHAMNTCLSVSAQQWGDHLRTALETIMRRATPLVYERAFTSLPTQALPEWFVKTDSTLDSATKFGNAACAFVRDFISAGAIESLLDEPTRAELIIEIGALLAATYPEYSGKTATVALKREIGQRWFKQLETYFEPAFNAIANKRGRR